jgi:hypothetical protein
MQAPESCKKGKLFYMPYSYQRYTLKRVYIDLVSAMRSGSGKSKSDTGSSLSRIGWILLNHLNL